MDQNQAQIGELTSALARLAQSVAELHTRSLPLENVAQAEPSEHDADVNSIDPTSSGLPTLYLNRLASDEDLPWDQEAASLAASGLSDGDPNVRAASARALGARAPAAAITLLSQRVAMEHNRFVRSIISSTLSALQG